MNGGVNLTTYLTLKKKRINYRLNMLDTIEEQKINTLKIIYDDLIKKIINVSELQREKIENISAQLSKYIPLRYMMRCLLESTTRRLKHKEGS